MERRLGVEGLRPGDAALCALGHVAVGVPSLRSGQAPAKVSVASGRWMLLTAAGDARRRRA